MGKRYYLADHHQQRKTGPLSRTNCAAASGAMMADQGTLGLKDPRVAYFRRLTDDTEGGLRINQIAPVLEDDFGLTVHLYDHDDNLKWDRLRRYLDRGCFAVVAGDYDVLPPHLKGADFDGSHAVVYHQRFRTNQRAGDPLRTDWVKWPNAIAYEYVRKFDRQTQGGIHAAIVIPRYARLRAGIRAIEVMKQPTKDATVLGIMTDRDKLITGGIVRGESIAGVDRWRRVWLPSAASLGYVHWTTTWKRG